MEMVGFGLPTCLTREAYCACQVEFMVGWLRHQMIYRFPRLNGCCLKPILRSCWWGTGADLIPLPKSLRDALQKKGIRADPMSTGAAARTFNVLLAEGRAVGAALLAVD